jgi:hypothetical protein
MTDENRHGQWLSHSDHQPASSDCHPFAIGVARRATRTHRNHRQLGRREAILAEHVWIDMRVCHANRSLSPFCRIKLDPVRATLISSTVSWQSRPVTDSLAQRELLMEHWKNSSFRPRFMPHHTRRGDTPSAWRSIFMYLRVRLGINSL